MTSGKGTDLIFVDLDNTLIRGDFFLEGVIYCAFHKPVALARALPAILWNRALGKELIAEQYPLDLKSITTNQAVIEFLTRKKEAGCSIILATAAAGSVATHCQRVVFPFDAVLSSSLVINLKGEAKLAEILQYCKKKGSEQFGYIGDSCADVPIWRRAYERWIVKSDGSIHEIDEQPSRIGIRWSKTCANLLGVFSLMRPHQWVKNLLLFLPIILAHALHDSGKLTSTFIAFAAFSLVASAVYATNDIVDINRDRTHPSKRFRPMAYGTINPLVGLFAAICFVLIGLGCAYVYTGAAFFAISAIYFAASLSYSMWLKQKPIIDVVVLSMLYTLRIFAGGVAAVVEVSKWLFTFSMFFFLSLAFAKRYQELHVIATGRSNLSGRGYIAQDLSIIASAGLAAGLMAVLVLAFYVRSPEVTMLYKAVDLLWFLCPLATYWVMRFWLQTTRGAMYDDPVVFAFRDQVSWLVGMLIAAVLVAAQFSPLDISGLWRK